MLNRPFNSVICGGFICGLNPSDQAGLKIDTSITIFLMKAGIMYGVDIGVRSLADRMKG